MAFERPHRKVHLRRPILGLCAGIIISFQCIINLTHKSSYSDYPPITSVEQRRKYKTEFDKDYSEYRQLHTVMEKARSRFAELQAELCKVNPSDKLKHQVGL